MNLYHSVSGFVRVRLISADIMQALKAISSVGIAIGRIKHKDALTVEFRLSRQDLRQLNAIIQHRGEKLELCGREGAYWGVRRLFQRPVLVLGVLLLLFLTIYLPTRVWFVSVEGNHQIPERMILEAAQECGITFGANARQIRSEKMKNELLSKIPALQWAGINTEGCVAVISVREKTLPETEEYRYPIISLVATQDGFVTSVTVTAGSAVCKIGQSVKAGQVLISAYTDCGHHIRATRAKGEVFANTVRQVNACALVSISQKTQVQDECHRYGLIIGKKQIFFSKGSGILGTECDRIKLVYYMTLPGGFQLPFGVIQETAVSYDVSPKTQDHDEVCALLRLYSQEYVLEQMVAGRVDHTEDRVETNEDCITLQSKYNCEEMICKSRTEEIMQKNE